MSTFLEMCRDLYRESGTADNFTTRPAAVTGQTGRDAKVVGWIAEAWVQIQNKHRTWRFRNTEFTAPLIASTGEYTAASLSLSNFGFWPPGRGEQDAFTTYDPNTGVSDEQPLYWLEWSVFKRRFLRGAHTDQRPRFWSVAPTGNLHIGPKPDKVYTLTGWYTRSAQRLASNTEEPILPTDYHQAIVSFALEFLAEHDEGGPLALLPGRRRWADYYRDMAVTELPEITRAGSKMA